MEDFVLLSQLSSSISGLDELIGGGFGVGIHVFQAQTGNGKTAALLQIAHGSQYPTIFLNCDMNQNDIYKRLITVTTDIPLNQISKLTREDLSDAQTKTSSSNTHLSFENGKAGFVGLDLLRSRIESIVEEQHPETVVLIIDSFNTWVDTACAALKLSKEKAVASLSTGLLDLIQDLNVTLITSAQETNENANRDTNEALMTIADTYIQMRWERNGRVDRDGLMESNLVAKKNRNAAPGQSRVLKFSGVHQKFQ